MAPAPVLTAAEVLAADGLADWRMLCAAARQLRHLVVRRQGGVRGEGGGSCRRGNHHPDVELRYGQGRA
ncbi:MAG: hypothetical protein R2734_11780 [Nocardioides sp.]